MGEVYLAFDERLGRRVALKRLRPDRPSQRERLHREARALAHLHHSSIVQCFDVVERGDEEWLVMEYVEGPRLADLVAGGPLPLDRVVEYGRQIAEGLQVAHARGIVHRDLKTENVVIDRSTDRAKILDFGLVRSFGKDGLDADSLTASGVMVGTVRAVSPEQAMGMTVGPQSDLFSLGVLLYEMVAGTSPYSARSPVATLSRIVGEAPEPLAPQVPEALDRLVFRLLEKSPENRPRDAAEVARTLGRLQPTLEGAESPRSVRSTPRSSGDPYADLEKTTLDAGLAAPASKTPPESQAPANSTASATSRRARVGWITLAGLGILLALVASVWLRSFISDSETAPRPSMAPASASSESDEPPSAEAGWEALEAYEEEGNIDRAIEIFLARIEADAESADDHAGLARAYWRKFYASSSDSMWVEQATALAQMAVELAKDEGEEARARTSLGLVQMEKGEAEQARRELEEALALDPASVDAYRGLAEVFQAGGQYDAAERSIGSALELSPEDHELYDLLGGLQFRRARYEEAESAFRRSVELAPNLGIGYRNLAGVYIARGELAEAAAMLERALAIRPTPSIHLNLGTVYFFQGLYSRAADSYEKALDSESGVHEPVAWANLGDAYRQIPQRRDEAPRAFQQAVRLLEMRLVEEGTEPDGWRLSQLALYQSKADLEEEARRTLGEFEAEDPRSLLRVATAWEILGERGKALESLSAAFDGGLDPDEVQRDPEFASLRSDRRYHELF